MPMEQWPCQPDSLEDVIAEDLIRFVLAGVAEKHRLPIAIVDAQRRYDPFDPRHQAFPFCRHLRGDPVGGTRGINGADAECRRWDNETALRILSDTSFPLNEPVRSPCWLGLDDYVAQLSVGNCRFVLFMGQLIREDYSAAGATAVERVVREKLDPISGQIPAASELEISELIPLLKYHPVVDDEILTRINACTDDVRQQFQEYWEMRRNAIEDDVYKGIVAQTQRLGVTQEGDGVNWVAIDDLMTRLCDQLDCEVAVLWAHESHRGRKQIRLENVLRLRSAHGISQRIRLNPPHFNWNKSRVEQFTGQHTIMVPDSAPVCGGGIRGGESLGHIGIDLLHSVSDANTGCRTVIGLGVFRTLEMARQRQEFLDRLLSVVVGRVHNLQLYAELYHADSLKQELAEFLAHQVRSKLQTLIGFQTIALRYAEGKAPIDSLTRQRTRLADAIEDLAAMSKEIHYPHPILYDPERMQFEEIDLLAVTEAAIEDQATYAELKGIEIRARVYGIPQIRVDPFWFRTMLNHLLNNAIKYSRQARDGHLRWIGVSTEHVLVMDELHVSIENFGLGILRSDLERVFERGVTAAEKGRFVSRKGEKRGLFEARRIVNAHGGRVWASSRHYSGGVVKPSNIEECITTLTVAIPVTGRR